MAGRGSWDEDRWDERGREHAESREPWRRNGRPDPSYRADYPERGIVGDGDVGGAYSDYGRAFSGYGAGGGYTPDYREGVGRERLGREGRSWNAHPSDAARAGAPAQANHRGRGPKGYVRSDERIREDVSDRLTDDPIVDASEIEVSVSGGEVTLNGAVHSKTAKRRAEDCADDVTGVRHVQNNLRVSHAPQPGTVGAQTDPRIAAVSEGRDADEAARDLSDDRLGALRRPHA